MKAHKGAQKDRRWAHAAQPINIYGSQRAANITVGGEYTSPFDWRSGNRRAAPRKNARTHSSKWRFPGMKYGN